MGRARQEGARRGSRRSDRSSRGHARSLRRNRPFAITCASYALPTRKWSVGVWSAGRNLEREVGGA